MGSAPASGRLVLRRLRTEYLVAGDHPAPHAMRAHLDDAAGRLGAALADAVAPTLDPGDPSVCFVRQLDVVMDVDAQRVRDEIAARWAEALTHTLAGRIGAADGDPGITWFASWDDYLAGFALDLATGQAWRRWYHEGRAGLRALPPSVALRTALAEQPERGMRALARLDPADLGRVLDALDRADAERLLVALTPGPGGDAGACRAAVREAAGGMRDGHGDAHAALASCVAVARRRAELLGSPLRRAALARVAAVRLLSGGARARGRLLLAALERGDGAAIAALVGAADAGRLAPLAGTADSALAALVHRGGAGSPAPIARRSTRFGGAFLLAPLLDALSIPEATDGWPDPPGTTAPPMLRLLALAAALGPGSREDPVVRELAGVPLDLEPDAIGAWPRRVPRGAAAHATIARHLVATGQAGADRVAVACARLARRSATIVIDAPRGHWLAVAAARASAAALARAAPAPALVFSGPRSAAAAAAAWPDTAIRSLDPGPDALGADAAVLLAEVERLPRELAALAPPPGCPPVLARLVVLLAHAVMRALARRLPGFAHAGVAHLQANVLAAPASIEPGDGRRVVHLGPAPLGVVLSLTGLTRTVYAAPWSDGPPFAIYPADGR